MGAGDPGLTRYAFPAIPKLESLIRIPLEIDSAKSDQGNFVLLADFAAIKP